MKNKIIALTALLGFGFVNQAYSADYVPTVATWSITPSTSAAVSGNATNTYTQTDGVMETVQRSWIWTGTGTAPTCTIYANFVANPSSASVGSPPSGNSFNRCTGGFYQGRMPYTNNATNWTLFNFASAWIGPYTTTATTASASVSKNHTGALLVTDEAYVLSRSETTSGVTGYASGSSTTMSTFYATP